jgi:hypothetical protein
MTSPVPFRQGMFRTEYSVVSVCHQQKPPTCFATITMYRAPIPTAVSTH